MAGFDWVPDFQALSTRKAKLLRVYGEFYERRRPAGEERDWPASWLRAIASPSEDLLDQGWPWTLWFAFADSPVFRFKQFTGPGPFGGEGFELTFEQKLPTVTNEPLPETVFVDEISELPPFSAVVGTSLQAISVLTWDGRLPDDHPVGIRLMFEASDIWLLSVWDEMEVRDRRPSDWEEQAQRWGFREWERPA